MKNILKYLNQQDKFFNQMLEIDKEFKGKNEVIGRFISMSVLDSKGYYRIVGETARRYILEYVYALDECAIYIYPEWGSAVKLPKQRIMKILKGQDKMTEIYG